MDRRRFLISCGICMASQGYWHPLSSSLAADEVARTLPADLKVCTELELSDLALAFEIARNEYLGNAPGHAQTKAAALMKKKWNPRRRFINVDFITEPEYLDKVISKGKLWEPHMGMFFRMGRGSPDILVSFDAGGSASYIGTDSTYYASKGRSSMNFGWFEETTDDTEFERTTVHEFGHALGLIHEHQHFQVAIPWKKEAVYAYYAKQGWNKDKVDAAIFAKYDSTQLNYTKYDSKSIMHYPIPASLVEDPTFAVGWNTTLSELDKKFISEFYPKQAGFLPE